MPGEVLVKFKSDAQPASVRAALSAQNARVVGGVAALGVQRLKVSEGQELAIIAALRRNSLVEYAEPNYILYAIDTNPDDTYFNPPYSRQWGLTQIQAPAAWDVTTGTMAITIAVVDTGVAQSHEDLGPKIIPGYDFYWEDSDPEDDHYYNGHSHGTHVAGIAAAETNNSMGVAGLSWGARIMPVKVLGPGGSGSVDKVANGITYAADNGAQVINLSLGGPDLANNATLKGAVNYAYGQGCLLVAAAGNDGISEPLYPAAYDHVVAVAATNDSDNRAWFSNYGSYVDVAAPGVNIYSTVRDIYGSYGYKDGTSMATPFVSGLAALIWSACPGYTNDQVESRIETTAVDLGAPGWDPYYGHGRIDAWHAVAPGLGASPQSVTFLADDTTDPIPSSHTVEVLNTGCEPITWTVAISPSTATWLTAIPLSGTATITSPGSISLSASKSGLTGHDTYSAQVVISTTQASVWGNPQTVDVKLTYMAELYKIILFPILKNYSW